MPFAIMLTRRLSQILPKLRQLQSSRGDVKRVIETTAVKSLYRKTCRSIDTSNSTVTVYLQLKDGFLLEAEIADTGVLPSEEEGPPKKTGVSQFLLDMTISACSTSARKQDDLRQLADSSGPDQHVGQLAFPISAIRQLATTSARVPISSSSRFISLVVHSNLLEVKVIRNLKENP
ncbi:hypothetical protein DY000_02042616 [Brassica cretica]|uniref:Uncharacterized protein n=1 Tax=Brassica cretica TaxID=69181 RepID=A0ABQ7BAS2_BRACR|nr:hypothetical protein DY000_02042616 [Brassica cretica]